MDCRPLGHNQLVAESQRGAMTIRSALGGAIVALTLVVLLLRGQDRPR